MKNFLEFLSMAIPFIEPYPYWIKLLVMARYYQKLWTNRKKKVYPSGIVKPNNVSE